MALEHDLAALIAGDARRMAALEAARALGLPDAWIGAGFARDAVWDHLHGLPPQVPVGDVDLLWFDPARIDPAEDEILKQRLRAIAPQFDWSARNQARMHIRNGDRPYRNVADAMTFWPETATMVAVRLNDAGKVEVNAPLGLADLFALRLTPGAHFRTDRRPIFDARVAAKAWLVRYPRLRLAPPKDPARPANARCAGGGIGRCGPASLRGLSRPAASRDVRVSGSLRPRHGR